MSYNEITVGVVATPISHLQTGKVQQGLGMAPFDLKNDHLRRMQLLEISPRSVSPSTRRRKNTSFSSSVSMRYVFTDPVDNHKIWYNESEIQSMKATAMKRDNYLRHSLPDGSKQTFTGLDHSTPPNDPPRPHNEAYLRTSIPRASSAGAVINASPAPHSSCPGSNELHYKIISAEIDREVFIDMDQRRKSMRRRINHYYAVLDEQDRQIASDEYKPKDLAESGSKTSADALVNALQTAHTEATVAKAILLGARLREALQ